MPIYIYWQLCCSWLGIAHGISWARSCCQCQLFAADWHLHNIVEAAEPKSRRYAGLGKVKVHARLIGRNLSCGSTEMSSWPGLLSWRAHHVIFIHCNRVLSAMPQKRVKWHVRTQSITIWVGSVQTCDGWKSSLCLKSFVFGSALGAHKRKSDSQYTQKNTSTHTQAPILSRNIAKTFGMW